MAKVLKEQQGKVLIYGNKAIKNPEPTKSWFYVTEYDSNGYPIKAKTIGCSGNLPQFLYGEYSDGGSYKNKITKLIQEVEINEGVSGLPHYAFQYCKSLTKITLPKTLTYMGNSTFQGCTSLTNFTIPSTITNMGTSSFSSCTKLASVIIENGVKNLPDYTFTWCSGLTSITIGDSVTSIGSQCFYGCSSCTLFDFRGATAVPTLSSTNAFQSTPSSKKIVVPDSLYDEWITATNWSSTTNNIVSSIIKASDYEASL